MESWVGFYCTNLPSDRVQFSVFGWGVWKKPVAFWVSFVEQSSKANFKIVVCFFEVADVSAQRPRALSRALPGRVHHGLDKSIPPIDNSKNANSRHTTVGW
jgi:hypothetical protein